MRFCNAITLVERIFKLSIGLVVFTTFAVSPVIAHGGHDHAPGEDGKVAGFGPISISAEARTNLHISTYEAQIATIQETLTALGQIEPIPGQLSAITSRISGRVSALFVNDGQIVTKGQPLIEVESRQIGDPPPRVSYKAPFDGIVIDSHAILGDTVDPEKHLMKIVDPSEFYAEGRIYEDELASIKPGQTTRVVVEAFPNEKYTGSIELVSGALDPLTRTVRVWVRLKNTNGNLRPNMRATLHIVVREAVSAISIPSRSILGDTGEKFVFVQSDSDQLTFERRRVVVGLHDDRLTEIIEGIFPGDLVVTEGGYQLQYVTPTHAKPE